MKRFRVVEIKGEEFQRENRVKKSYVSVDCKFGIIRNES